MNLSGGAGQPHQAILEMIVDTFLHPDHKNGINFNHAGGQFCIAHGMQKYTGQFCIAWHAKIHRGVMKVCRFFDWSVEGVPVWPRAPIQCWGSEERFQNWLAAVHFQQKSEKSDSPVSPVSLNNIIRAKRGNSPVISEIRVSHRASLRKYSLVRSGDQPEIFR